MTCYHVFLQGHARQGGQVPLPEGHDRGRPGLHLPRAREEGDLPDRRRVRRRGHRILAIFYPFSQFCEMVSSLPSL